MRYQNTADLSCKPSHFRNFIILQGVSIETVSRMMVHTNIKTTQIYAKITKEKISQDIEILSEKLSDLENKLIDEI